MPCAHAPLGQSQPMPAARKLEVAADVDFQAYGVGRGSGAEKLRGAFGLTVACLDECRGRHAAKGRVCGDGARAEDIRKRFRGVSGQNSQRARWPGGERQAQVGCRDWRAVRSKKAGVFARVDQSGTARDLKAGAEFQDFGVRFSRREFGKIASYDVQERLPEKLKRTVGRSSGIFGIEAPT